MKGWRYKEVIALSKMTIANLKVAELRQGHGLSAVFFNISLDGKQMRDSDLEWTIITEMVQFVLYAKDIENFEEALKKIKIEAGKEFLEIN